MAATFGITARAFRWYEDNGSESASTAIAAENANITRQGSAPNVVLRYGVQESGSGSVSGATTDDYQLQVSKNGGAYANVTGATANIRARLSANLTDAAATTNRLSAGTGAFVAGEIDEADGLVTDWQLTADNFSELLYSLELVPADLANGNTLDFRVLRNGAVFNTYSVTPRITFSVPPTADNAYETAIFADSPTFVASMEEASGNLADLMAGKVGTANGTPTYGLTGPIAGKTAISFDNIADFFSFADHADLALGDGPFSIEFWLRRDLDNNNQQGVVRKGTNAYAVNINGPSGPNPDGIGLGKQGVAFLCASSTDIPVDTTWRHIVITRSAAGAGNTLIYINKTEGHVDSASIGTALADTAVALEIGKDDSTLDGALAYVALYKSVLSSTRVAAHYDAASGSSIARTAADALAAADAIVRAFSGARALADTHGRSDSGSRTFAGSRTTTDAVTLADVATQAKTLIRSVADALGFADAATRAGNFLRSTTDGITWADVVEAVKSGSQIARTAADAIGLTGAVTRTGSFIRSTTEGVTQSDVATRAVARIRTTTEALGLADAATRALSVIRSATDAATYTDAASRALAAIRSAADATGLSDAAVAVVTGAVTIGSVVISLAERIAAALGLTERYAASMTLSLRYEAALSVATEYDLNDTASPSATFTVDGVSTDPTTITLTVIPPDKSTATYTYAGGTVTRSSTGVYTKNITLNQRGVWYLQFAGTGACQATAEATVRVRA